MSYSSTNGTFVYTITNNTNYVIEQLDYDIILSTFNRWESLITIDSRFGSSYTITISYIIDTLDAGVLGGASITNSSYVDTYIYGNVVPLTANITMNNTYLQGMKTTVRNDGYTSYYHVLLHEIGHILGIGSFWYLTGCPKTSYDDNGTTKYYYTGTNALREYKSCFAGFSNDAFLGIPIEDDGGAGTAGVHPEEGPEGGVSSDNRYINGILHPGLDTELMTGWLDGSPVSTPLSRITLGFLEDMGYTVNYNLADVYIMAWLATTEANNLEQTYIQGFLDISGGNIINRHDNLSILQGTMDVSGAVAFNSRLDVGGDVSLNGDLTVAGDFNAQYPDNSIPAAAIDGQVEATPNFAGDVDFQSNVDISDNLTVRNKVAIGSTTLPTGSTALKVTGDLDVTGDMTVVSDATINGLTVGKGKEGIAANTAFGVLSLSTIIAGTQNTATGFHSLKANTGGNYNSAYGGYALLANEGGSNNTATGYNALKANTSNNQNTAIGSYSLLRTTGASNTAVGYLAGDTNVAGAGNTYLGASTDCDNASYNYSTAVGYNAKVTASNQIMLGTAAETVVAPGQVDICGNLYAQYDIVTPTIPAGAIIGGVGSNVFDSGDVSMNTNLSVGGDATFNGALEKSAMLPSNDISGVNVVAYGSQTWAESGSELGSVHDDTSNALNRAAISRDGLFMLRRDVVTSGVNSALKYRNIETGTEVQVTGSCRTYQMNDNGDTVLVAVNSYISADDHEVWEKQADDSWLNVYTIATTTTATMSYDGTVICSFNGTTTAVVMHKKTNGTWATNGTITLPSTTNGAWAPAINANGTRIMCLVITQMKLWTFENNSANAWEHTSSSTGTYSSQTMNDAGQTTSTAISDDGSYIALGRWNTPNCPAKIHPWPIGDNWDTTVTTTLNHSTSTRTGKALSFRGSTSTGFTLGVVTEYKGGVNSNKTTYYIYASDGNPANLTIQTTESASIVGNSANEDTKENSIVISGGRHRALVGCEISSKIQLISLPSSEYSHKFST
jgi:hypothetical protein